MPKKHSKQAWCCADPDPADYLDNPWGPGQQKFALPNFPGKISDGLGLEKVKSLPWNLTAQPANAAVEQASAAATAGNSVRSQDDAKAGAASSEAATASADSLQPSGNPKSVDKSSAPAAGAFPQDTATSKRGQPQQANHQPSSLKSSTANGRHPVHRQPDHVAEFQQKEIPLAQMGDDAIERAIIAAHARANGTGHDSDEDEDQYVWEGEQNQQQQDLTGNYDDQADDATHDLKPAQSAPNAFSQPNKGRKPHAAAGSFQGQYRGGQLPGPGMHTQGHQAAQSEQHQYPQFAFTNADQWKGAESAQGVSHHNAQSAWSQQQIDQWQQWYHSTVNPPQQYSDPSAQPHLDSSTYWDSVSSLHRYTSQASADPASGSADHAQTRQPGMSASGKDGLVLVPASLLRRYQQLEWAEWRRRYSEWEASYSAYCSWYDQYQQWWQQNGGPGTAAMPA